MVKRILQVSESIDSGKYLGLPSRPHLEERIQNWSGKHLSIVGREVLIKSVSQLISTYFLSSFLLPTTLREEMQILLNLFWWGSNRQNGKGINC